MVVRRSRAKVDGVKLEISLACNQNDRLAEKESLPYLPLEARWVERRRAYAG